MKSAPLQARSEMDSKTKLALYSGSYSSIHGSTESSRHEYLAASQTLDNDPILAYVTSQRGKLDLETTPMKNPDLSEGSIYRELLLAKSTPIAGVKDLQVLSRKLSTLQASESQRKRGRRIATLNDFVYALRKDEHENFTPYDLCIVSAERARMHNRYYTVSAFSIAEVNHTVWCCSQYYYYYDVMMI